MEGGLAGAGSSSGHGEREGSRAVSSGQARRALADSCLTGMGPGLPYFQVFQENPKICIFM